MAGEKNKTNELNRLSESMMKMYVADVFKRNDVSNKAAKRLSDEQKKEIREMVENLKAQVDDFLNQQKKQKIEDSSEKEEVRAESPLREAFKRSKKKK